MKILAFADPHFKESIPKKLIAKAKDVDLVLCAGDFTWFGANFDKIMKDFSKFKKPVGFVHGNHEEGQDFRKLPKHIKFLHKKGFVVGDYLFVGYGGGGFSERYPDLEEMIPKIKKRKGNKKVVLVTHAPVYGTTTDYLDHAGHVGSKSALKFIKEVKPMLVICGHIEENFGQIDHVGKTIVILPNDTGRIIEV
jgi:uncharacterized protein